MSLNLEPSCCGLFYKGMSSPYIPRVQRELYTGSFFTSRVMVLLDIGKNLFVGVLFTLANIARVVCGIFEVVLASLVSAVTLGFSRNATIALKGSLASLAGRLVCLVKDVLLYGVGLLLAPFALIIPTISCDYEQTHECCEAKIEARIESELKRESALIAAFFRAGNVSDLYMDYSICGGCHGQIS